MSGEAYVEFVDRFVEAVKRELPGTLLQWEDFATPNARPLLNRYRDSLLTFNDDIQGTAAVALGALLAATRVAGRSLREQTIVFLGAGSAAIGVADTLRAAMVAEGLSDAEARRRFWIVDVNGLLVDARTDLAPEQRVYARAADEVAGFPRTHRGAIGLADVIRGVEATVLIGLSTAAGAFTEAIVREMAGKTPRPVIFPLSNPTARAEARPEDLIQWTDGRALVATGLALPARGPRRARVDHFPVQQRLHLPGRRPRRRRRGRAARLGRDAARRGAAPRGALARADGLRRVAPAAARRAPERGRRGRVRGRRSGRARGPRAGRLRRATPHRRRRPPVVPRLRRGTLTGQGFCAAMSGGTGTFGSFHAPGFSSSLRSTATPFSSEGSPPFTREPASSKTSMSGATPSFSTTHFPSRS